MAQVAQAPGGVCATVVAARAGNPQLTSAAMPSSASLRVFLSQEDVHYAGGLVAGARILGLFGDVATGLLLENDGVEGLLARYDEVEFLRPVYGGDTVEVEAVIESQGTTSRRLRLEARVGGEPVCRAHAVVIAKPLPAR
jgi:acyl-CoA hydrolase